MIAIIPARSGSRRIPNKNIKEFRGKPMIRYAVEAAERSGLFDRIMVSTDDSDIADIARRGWIERPEALARDHIGTQEVMKDAVRVVVDLSGRGDITCCIYPTTPLMAPEDLARGYNMLRANPHMDYAFSVGANPLQDAGQFYFGYCSAFLRDSPLISEKSLMVPISEDRVCDINTPEDWSRAEEMYDKLHGGRP